jgi:hypothetical protein
MYLLRVQAVGSRTRAQYHPRGSAVTVLNFRRQAYEIICSLCYCGQVQALDDADSGSQQLPVGLWSVIHACDGQVVNTHRADPSHNEEPRRIPCQVYIVRGESVTPHRLKEFCVLNKTRAPARIRLLLISSTVIILG